MKNVGRSSFYTRARCGWKHDSKYLANTYSCFSCGKSCNKMRDCSLFASKRRDGSQAMPNGSGSSSPK